MTMRYRASLFDLDGTLLDTLADLADAMNAALDSMRLPPHPLAAYKYFVGDGMHELALRALPPEGRDTAAVAQCLDAMRKQYLLNWNVKTRPYRNIKPLLVALEKKNIALAVLSNKPHPLTVRMVEYFFPKVRFAEVRGLLENKPRKPDPASALEIADAIGIKPDEFFYCGDTNTDMQTARAAGMKAVGVLWGFRTKEELLASGAEIIVTTPLEVLEIFK